ncbi:hypothetical protein [Paragemmobacter aquarius]|uniref:hypothetical protein n=1 Tax=Paragemmobacter aquarius TaxID=2169400 RepID=UPI001C1FFE1B|nr:hypothetical protein [Gemmobacter aquarius]
MTRRRTIFLRKITPTPPPRRPLPPLCRPAGWIAQWRRIGALCVLDCKGVAFL